MFKWIDWVSCGKEEACEQFLTPFLSIHNNSNEKSHKADTFLNRCYVFNPSLKLDANLYETKIPSEIKT